MILTVTTHTEAGCRVMHIWRNGGTLCYARALLRPGVSVKDTDLLNWLLLTARLKRTVGYTFGPLQRPLTFAVASGTIDRFSIFMEV